MSSNLRKRQDKRTYSPRFEGLKRAADVGRFGDSPINPNDPIEVLTYKLAEVDRNLKVSRHFDFGNKMNLPEKTLKKLYDLAEELQKANGLEDYQKIKLAAAIQRRAYRISNSEHAAQNPNLDNSAIGLVEQMEKRYGVKPHSVLEKSAVVALIVGVLGGLFFLSSNITGNAIADMTVQTSSFIGAGLIVVGLIASFFWLRKKR